MFCVYDNVAVGYDNVSTDPFMMLVVPVEQWKSQYTIATVKGVSGPYNNFINVIIKTREISGLRLDNRHVNPSAIQRKSWTQIQNTEFSGAQIHISDDIHTQFHVDPTVVFSVNSYGHTEFESYGYPAAMRVASLYGYCTSSPTEEGDGLDNDCDGRIDEELCDGLDNDGDGATDEDLVICDHTTEALHNASLPHSEALTAPQIAFTVLCCVASATLLAWCCIGLIIPFFFTRNDISSNTPGPEDDPNSKNDFSLDWMYAPDSHIKQVVPGRTSYTEPVGRIIRIRQKLKAFPPVSS
jgi:hypothetical protein